MKRSGIYRIRNTVTGKVYVGSAKNLDARQRQHWSALRLNKHDSEKLQRSWNKHGLDSFVFEIIEQVEELSLLLAREQFWLDKVQPFGSAGYNASRLATSRLGMRASDDLCRKLSDAHTGKKLSEPHRLALAASKQRQDVRDKISASLKGRGPSKEHMDRMHLINIGNSYSKGKKRDPAAVAKTAAANIGNKHSLGFKHTAETLAKRALSRRGVPWTESRRAAYERSKTEA